MVTVFRSRCHSQRYNSTGGWATATSKMGAGPTRSIGQAARHARSVTWRVKIRDTYSPSIGEDDGVPQTACSCVAPEGATSARQAFTAGAAENQRRKAREN